VAMTGRMVPMQALMTKVPDVNQRGAFLSANSAIMALGTGCGAWLGGVFLSSGPNGFIEGYGTDGWLSVALFVVAIIWIARVKSADVTAPANFNTPKVVDALGD
jgi:DHA1 family inner membrane transport protein